MSPISLIVRGVKKEDKTLAVGIQFMLLRVLGKEPPVQTLTVCRGWGTGMSETQSLTLGFTGPWGSRSNPGTCRWVYKQLDTPAGRSHLTSG